MTPRSKRNPKLPGEYVGRSMLVEEPSTGSYKDGDIHTVDKDHEPERSRQQSSKSGKQVHYSIDVSIPRDPSKIFNHPVLSDTTQVPHDDKVLIRRTAR